MKSETEITRNNIGDLMETILEKSDLGGETKGSIIYAAKSNDYRPSEFIPEGDPLTTFIVDTLERRQYLDSGNTIQDAIDELNYGIDQLTKARNNLERMLSIERIKDL